MYFCVLCIVCFVTFPVFVCVYMCTEQLPPGGYPIAVKYIAYHITTCFGLCFGRRQVVFNLSSNDTICVVYCGGGRDLVLIT